MRPDDLIQFESGHIIPAGEMFSFDIGATAKSTEEIGSADAIVTVKKHNQSNSSTNESTTSQSEESGCGFTCVEVVVGFLILWGLGYWLAPQFTQNAMDKFSSLVSQTQNDHKAPPTKEENFKAKEIYEKWVSQVREHITAYGLLEKWEAESLQIRTRYDYEPNGLEVGRQNGEKSRVWLAHTTISYKKKNTDYQMKLVLSFQWTRSKRWQYWEGVTTNNLYSAHDSKHYWERIDWIAHGRRSYFAGIEGCISLLDTRTLTEIPGWQKLSEMMEAAN